MRLSKVQQLRNAGFDQSRHIPFTKTYRVRCSRCEVAVINGTPCHENGCSNRPCEERNESED